MKLHIKKILIAAAISMGIGALTHSSFAMDSNPLPTPESFEAENNNFHGGAAISVTYYDEVKNLLNILAGNGQKFDKQLYETKMKIIKNAIKILIEMLKDEIKKNKAIGEAAPISPILPNDSNIPAPILEQVVTANNNPGVGGDTPLPIEPIENIKNKLTEFISKSNDKETYNLDKKGRITKLKRHLEQIEKNLQEIFNEANNLAKQAIKTGSRFMDLDKVNSLSSNPSKENIEILKQMIFEDSYKRDLVEKGRRAGVDDKHIDDVFSKRISIKQFEEIVNRKLDENKLEEQRKLKEKQENIEKLKKIREKQEKQEKIKEKQEKLKEKQEKMKKKQKEIKELSEKQAKIKEELKKLLEKQRKLLTKQKKLKNNNEIDDDIEKMKISINDMENSINKLKNEAKNVKNEIDNDIAEIDNDIAEMDNDININNDVKNMSSININNVKDIKINDNINNINEICEDSAPKVNQNANKNISEYDDLLISAVKENLEQFINFNPTNRQKIRETDKKFFIDCLSGFKKSKKVEKVNKKTIGRLADIIEALQKNKKEKGEQLIAKGLDPIKIKEYLNGELDEEKLEEHEDEIKRKIIELKSTLQKYKINKYTAKQYGVSPEELKLLEDFFKVFEQIGNSNKINNFNLSFENLQKVEQIINRVDLNEKKKKEGFFEKPVQDINKIEDENIENQNLNQSDSDTILLAAEQSASIHTLDSESKKYLSKEQRNEYNRILKELRKLSSELNEVLYNKNMSVEEKEKKKNEIRKSISLDKPENMVKRAKNLTKQAYANKLKEEYDVEVDIEDCSVEELLKKLAFEEAIQELEGYYDDIDNIETVIEHLRSGEPTIEHITRINNALCDINLIKEYNYSNKKIRIKRIINNLMNDSKNDETKDHEQIKYKDKNIRRILKEGKLLLEKKEFLEKEGFIKKNKEGGAAFKVVEDAIKKSNFKLIDREIQLQGDIAKKNLNMTIDRLERTVDLAKERYNCAEKMKYIMKIDKKFREQVGNLKKFTDEESGYNNKSLGDMIKHWDITHYCDDNSKISDEEFIEYFKIKFKLFLEDFKRRVDIGYYTNKIPEHFSKELIEFFNSDVKAKRLNIKYRKAYKNLLDTILKMKEVKEILETNDIFYLWKKYIEDFIDENEDLFDKKSKNAEKIDINDENNKKMWYNKDIFNQLADCISMNKLKKIEIDYDKFKSTDKLNEVKIDYDKFNKIVEVEFPKMFHEGVISGPKDGFTCSRDDFLKFSVDALKQNKKMQQTNEKMSSIDANNIIFTALAYFDYFDPDTKVNFKIMQIEDKNDPEINKIKDGNNFEINEIKDKNDPEINKIKDENNFEINEIKDENDPEINEIKDENDPEINKFENKKNSKANNKK